MVQYLLGTLNISYLKNVFWPNVFVGASFQILEILKYSSGLKDVIVADGGSTDETREIAMNAGAIVVESPKGRGLQIEKGINAASADVIIILHADCEAKRGVFESILKSLDENPHAVGGAVGMQFKQKKLGARVVAALNNLRARLTGVSFGDQFAMHGMRLMSHDGETLKLM